MSIHGFCSYGVQQLIFEAVGHAPSTSPSYALSGLGAVLDGFNQLSLRGIDHYIEPCSNLCLLLKVLSSAMMVFGTGFLCLKVTPQQRLITPLVGFGLFAGSSILSSYLKLKSAHRFFTQAEIVKDSLTSALVISTSGVLGGSALSYFKWAPDLNPFALGIALGVRTFSIEAFGKFADLKLEKYSLDNRLKSSILFLYNLSVYYFAKEIFAKAFQKIASLKFNLSLGFIS